MARNNPRVSIGLPVYNGERFLDEALNSVLAQTYSDFELIISDNASTDRTQQICETYAARNPRIRYFRNDVNLGAARNFNRVFELSSGEYFKWLAVDDAIEPAFLARCVELLDKDPAIILAYPRLKVNDQYFGTGLRDGTMPYEELDLQSTKASERLRQMLFLVIPCVYPIFGLMRADVLKQTSLVGAFVGADHCLLVDLILRGRFGEVPEYLMQARWHPESYGCKLARIRESGGVEGTAQAEWYDPENKGKIFLPQWRRLREYFLLILRCRARLAEKTVMLAYLFGVAGGLRQCLGAELGSAVKQRFQHTRLARPANLLAGVIDAAFRIPMETARMIFRRLALHKKWLRPSPKTGRAQVRMVRDPD